MSRCQHCKRKIPAELLSPLMTTGGNFMNMCGVCALEISNQVLGIKRTKFTEGMAEQLRLDAVNHYKKTKQLKK